MKKLYMILAAVAAMTFSAQAQTADKIFVGDYESPAETYNGSYFDMAPTNFYLAHTGAQMIFTPDLLADMNDKQDVQIVGLYFKFNDQSFEEIARDYKIYVQQIDETEFAVNEEGVKQFFTFDNLVAEDALAIDLLEYYGEDFEIGSAIQAVDYTPGKSLLVTIVFDAQDDDNCTMGSDYAPFYTSGIRGKAMTYTSNTVSFLDYAQGNDFPDATATLGCGSNVELPVTLIQYTYDNGEQTGFSEINEGKTVAGVRYYNMAGQEMAQPNGVTIQVTTYTDGTTSSAKVMK